MTRTLGQRVRGLREAQNLSQVELAKRLSVVNSTVSQWEADKRMPESGTLQLLADFFHVSVDYLLGRTDDPGDAKYVKDVVTGEPAPESNLPSWLYELPPEMQQFVRDESKNGWHYLRLARGLKMQDLSPAELHAIIETWMDAKKRYEKEFGK